MGGGGAGGVRLRPFPAERGSYGGAGLSVPLAIRSGVGWYRHATCGGTINLCVKKKKLSKRGPLKARGPVAAFATSATLLIRHCDDTSAGIRRSCT